MDEMKLKLSTKLMRSVASKILAKVIYKKFGYKVDIHLNEIDLSIVDGEANLNANVELKMNSNEFIKLMKGIEND